MHKVVIDTNVFISAIFWNNDCSEIIELWKSSKIVLISSIPIIEELLETLRDFKIHLATDSINELKNTILNNAIIVNPKSKVFIIKDDPDDNKFIEAAIAGDAKYIITQDKHLLRVSGFCAISIITPRDFIRLF